MSGKILIVDDDTRFLDAYRDMLRIRYQIETASGPVEGLRALSHRGPFAVVVSDFSMPYQDGIEFLSRVRDISPDTVRIMLTGTTNPGTPAQAVNLATIYRFLPKPCPIVVLTAALDEAIRHHRLIISERELIEKTLMGSIGLMSDILALSDSATHTRNEASRRIARSFCKALDIPNAWEVELAAILGDIGLMAVPRELLRKMSCNSDPHAMEDDIFNHVSEISGTLLSNIPRLENVAKIIQYRSKDFDGGGYPLTNAGEEIPMGSRVLRFLKDLDPERSGDYLEQTIALAQRHPGRYDPKVIDAALAVFSAGTDEQTSQTRKRNTRNIPLVELRIGQRLRSPIASQDGTVLVASGQIISSPLLERLNAYGKLGQIRSPIAVES